eukprot:4800337-Pyramimonas_sp.AAC.1
MRNVPASSARLRTPGQGRPPQGRRKGKGKPRGRGRQHAGQGRGRAAGRDKPSSSRSFRTA